MSAAEDDAIRSFIKWLHFTQGAQLMVHFEGEHGGWHSLLARRSLEKLIAAWHDDTEWSAKQPRLLRICPNCASGYDCERGVYTVDEKARTTLTVSDTPKSLRETFATAQTAISGTSWTPAGGKEAHLRVLGRLIAECDRLRPLGPDGKHGEDQHTPTCGCTSDEIRDSWAGPNEPVLEPELAPKSGEDVDPLDENLEDPIAREAAGLPPEARRRKLIFTFGYGQPLNGHRVEVITYTYEGATQLMARQFGSCWAFAYTPQQWEDSPELHYLRKLTEEPLVTDHRDERRGREGV